MAAQQRAELHQRVEMHMGTAVILSVPVSLEQREAADEVFAACFERARELDAVFSPYKPESEISRFGRGEITKNELSPEVCEVLDFCDKLHAVSNGAFDIHAAATQPPARELQQSDNADARPLDPSGAVKGWAIEQCADLFRRSDIHNFCVNIGGDIFAGGCEAPDQPWRVGLQHPDERSNIMEVLSVSDTGVATSGLYERGEHIVGTNHELCSVTVVGADIALADAYATTAFVMGRRGVNWILEQRGFDVFAVTSEREVLASSGLARFRAW